MSPPTGRVITTVCQLDPWSTTLRKGIDFPFHFTKNVSTPMILLNSKVRGNAAGLLEISLLCLMQCSHLNSSLTYLSTDSLALAAFSMTTIRSIGR